MNMMRQKAIALLLAIMAAIVPGAIHAQTPSHFVWGADLGGGIDLSSHDMSTLNLDAYFGYRGGIVDALGVGAAINMMVNNSNRAFPVYALFRSSFRTAPSLCFFDLRGGIVFNNLSDNTTRSGLYLSPGIGVNLARGKTSAAISHCRTYITACNHTRVRRATTTLTDCIRHACVSEWHSEYFRAVKNSCTKHCSTWQNCYLCITTRFTTR